MIYSVSNIARILQTKMLWYLYPYLKYILYTILSNRIFIYLENKIYLKLITNYWRKTVWRTTTTTLCTTYWKHILKTVTEPCTGGSIKRDNWKLFTMKKNVFAGIYYVTMSNEHSLHGVIVNMIRIRIKIFDGHKPFECSRAPSML